MPVVQRTVIRCNKQTLLTLIVIVIIISRFVKCPQKLSRGNQFIHRRWIKEKLIDIVYQAVAVLGMPLLLAIFVGILNGQPLTTVTKTIGMWSTESWYWWGSDHFYSASKDLHYTWAIYHAMMESFFCILGNRAQSAKLWSLVPMV